MKILELLENIKRKILHADAMAPTGNPFDPEMLHHQLDNLRTTSPEVLKRRHVSTYVWVEKSTPETKRVFRKSIIKAKKDDDKRKKA